MSEIYAFRLFHAQWQIWKEREEEKKKTDNFY